MQRAAHTCNSFTRRPVPTLCCGQDQLKRTAMFAHAIGLGQEVFGAPDMLDILCRLYAKS